MSYFSRAGHTSLKCICVCGSVHIFQMCLHALHACFSIQFLCIPAFMSSVGGVEVDQKEEGGSYLLGEGGKELYISFGETCMKK